MPHVFDEESQEYFERLNAQLRRMPQADRAEIYAEVRQHLDELTKAHEELGASLEEANRAALRQFGDPVKIGRRLFLEWKKTTPTSLWRIAGWASLWVYVINTGVTLFWMKGVPRIMSSDSVLPLSLFLYFYFSLHILVGVWASRRFGRRALPGLACMIASVFVLAPILTPLQSLLWSAIVPLTPSAHTFHLHFETYQASMLIQKSIHGFLLLTGAWLAQKFDGPPRLSPVGIKSRF